MKSKFEFDIKEVESEFSKSNISSLLLF